MALSPIRPPSFLANMVSLHLPVFGAGARRWLSRSFLFLRFYHSARLRPAATHRFFYLLVVIAGSTKRNEKITLIPKGTPDTPDADFDETIGNTTANAPNNRTPNPIMVKV